MFVQSNKFAVCIALYALFCQTNAEARNKYMQTTCGRHNTQIYNQKQGLCRRRLCVQLKKYVERKMELRSKLPANRIAAKLLELHAH